AAGGVNGGGTGRPGAVVAGTAWRRGPHETLGSVPRTNAIVTTRTHSLDGSRSIGTSDTRSGTGKSSRGLSPRTLVMYGVQIGTGVRPPVSSRPRLRGRS